MTWTLDLRPGAARDISIAKRWYDERSNSLGAAFIDDVFAVIRSAVSSPLLYPLVFRRTHRALLARFPYAVYYRIKERTVVVVAVVHTHRHPHAWQMREMPATYAPKVMAACPPQSARASNPTLSAC